MGRTVVQESGDYIGHNHFDTFDPESDGQARPYLCPHGCYLTNTLSASIKEILLQILTIARSFRVRLRRRMV